MRWAPGGFVACLAILIAWTMMLKFNTPVDELPPGFRRHQFQHIKASIPYPDGWFTRERMETGCIAGYLTQDDTFKKGSFETGLTINFMENVSDSSNRKASEYAAAYAELGTSEKKVLLPVNQSEDNGRRRFTYRLTGDGIVVHYLLIADDRQNTIHLMFFESPVEDWEAAWKVGAVMMQNAEFAFSE